MYLFKKKSPFNILFLKNKFSVTIGNIVLGLSQLFPQRLKERKHEGKNGSNRERNIDEQRTILIRATNTSKNRGLKTPQKRANQTTKKMRNMLQTENRQAT